MFARVSECANRLLNDEHIGNRGAKLAAQNEKYPRNRLREPLPIHGDMMPFPQLMSISKEPGEMMARKINEHLSADQSSVMLYSAAPSGTGKTHLAYEVGRKYAYSVVIQAMNPNNADSGPWRCLHKPLAELVDKNAKHHDLRETTNASARSYVRLFVFCIVDVARALLKFGQEQSLSEESRHELFLYFFRDGGKGTELYRILQESFEAMVGVLETRQNEVRGIDEDAYRVWRESLKGDISSGLPKQRAKLSDGREVVVTLLLTFDEAPALHGCYGTLFHRKSDPGEKCDLLNALSSCVGEIVSSHGDRKWASYFTGTALSMERVLTSSFMDSSLRVGLTKVSPLELFGVDHMNKILAHYWHIPKGVLELDEVRSALEMLSGRPQLFVDGVFRAFVSEMKALAETATPPQFREIFARVAQEGAHTTKVKYRFLLSEKFEANRPLAQEPALTFTALLPSLVKAVLFESGVLRLTSGSKRVSVNEIIASGLVGYAGDIEGLEYIDISKERAVFEAYREYLTNQSIDSVLDALTASPNGFSSSAAGEVAEQAIAFCIAFKHVQIQHERRLKAEAEAKADAGEDALLSEVASGYGGHSSQSFPTDEDSRSLSPLQSSPPNAAQTSDYIGLDVLLTHLGAQPKDFSSLEGWETRASCARDMQDDMNLNPLDRFVVKQKGRVQIDRLDDTVILYNICREMGPDLLFLCSKLNLVTSKRDYRVVAIQSKNSSASTVREMLATLSPGLLFLTNTSRESALANVSKCKNLVSSNRKRWDAVCKMHTESRGALSSLTRGWIRICVTSRNASHQLVEKLKKEKLNIFVITFTDKWIPKRTYKHIIPQTESQLSLPSGAMTWTEIAIDDVKGKIGAAKEKSEAMEVVEGACGASEP